MQTQRYARDADGRPILEVVTWDHLPGHPRATEDGYVWVSAENLLVDLFPLVDEDFVPTIPDAEFGALFELPLKPGIELITREQYEGDVRQLMEQAERRLLRERDEHEASVAEALAQKARDDAAREAIAERLGLSPEELRLLLGGSVSTTPDPDPDPDDDDDCDHPGQGHAHGHDKNKDDCMASVCIGCGLNVDGDGKLYADAGGTSADNVNGAATLDGSGGGGALVTCDEGGVWCDETTGKLRSYPRQYAVENSTRGVEAFTVREADGRATVLESERVAIRNPSACLSMRVTLTGEIRVQWDGNTADPGVSFDAFFEEGINGSSLPNTGLVFDYAHAITREGTGVHNDAFFMARSGGGPGGTRDLIIGPGEFAAYYVGLRIAALTSRNVRGTARSYVRLHGVNV